MPHRISWGYQKMRYAFLFAWCPCPLGFFLLCLRRVRLLSFEAQLTHVTLASLSCFMKVRLQSALSSSEESVFFCVFCVSIRLPSREKRDFARWHACSQCVLHSGRGPFLFFWYFSHLPRRYLARRFGALVCFLLCFVCCVGSVRLGSALSSEGVHATHSFYTLVEVYVGMRYRILRW